MKSSAHVVIGAVDDESQYAEGEAAQGIFPLL